MIAFLKKILGMLCGGKAASNAHNSSAYTVPAGTHGRLEAETALASEDDRLVLSVGHDFEDVPSWVEWDLGTGRLSIAQMGGAVAELALSLPSFYRERRLKDVRRIALVTGAGPDKLMHFVAFIAR